MIEIFNQIRDKCPICKNGFGVFYLPYTDEDREKSKAHKLFQIVRNQIFGIKKPRSIKQLNTYFATCQFIADHTDHKQWNTKKKVNFQCRVGTHFVDPDLVIVKKDGSVQFSYRSIAFKNLGHIGACNYFEQAYGIMADFWNVTHERKITTDQLVEMTKEAMGSE